MCIFVVVMLTPFPGRYCGSCCLDDGQINLSVAELFCKVVIRLLDNHPTVSVLVIAELCPLCEAMSNAGVGCVYLLFEKLLSCEAVCQNSRLLRCACLANGTLTPSESIQKLVASQILFMVKSGVKGVVWSDLLEVVTRLSCSVVQSVRVHAFCILESLAVFATPFLFANSIVPVVNAGLLCDCESTIDSASALLETLCHCRLSFGRVSVTSDGKQSVFGICFGQNYPQRVSVHW